MTPLEQVALVVDDNVIKGVLFLDAAPDAAQIAKALDRLAARATLLRCRVRPTPQPHFREVTGFRGADNFSVRDVNGPLTRHDCLAMLGELTCGFPDGARPPWRYALVRTAADGEAPAALLFCCHHALVDGIRAINLALGLQDTDDPPNVAAGLENAPVPQWQPAWPVRLLANLAALGTLSLILVPGMLVAPLLAAPPAKSRPHFIIGRAPRRLLRAECRRLNCTLETVYFLMARSVINRLRADNPVTNDGGKSGKGPFIQFPMAFSKNGRGMVTGNYFTWAEMRLPTAPTDDAASLIEATVDKLKQRLSPFALHVMQCFMTWSMRAIYVLPDGLVKRLKYRYMRRFDASVSVVPGPPKPLRFRNAKGAELHGFVPLMTRQTVSIAFITYAGHVHVGIACDPARYPQTEGLRRALATLETDVSALL